MRSNVREWTHVLIVNKAQLLHNWREQRPSNQGDLDPIVTVKVGRVYYTAVDLLLISFLYRSTWSLLGCVLNGTPCTYGMTYTAWAQPYTSFALPRVQSRAWEQWRMVAIISNYTTSTSGGNMAATWLISPRKQTSLPKRFHPLPTPPDSSTPLWFTMSGSGPMLWFCGYLLLP
jgi:hypothetical protein